MEQMLCLMCSPVRQSAFAWSAIVLANAFAAGLPACRVLWTDPESCSLMGDRNKVAPKCCGIRATPDVMPDVVVVGWPDVPAFVMPNVTGASWKRLFSLSCPSLPTSGVGIRGRFFRGTDDIIEPFKLILESGEERLHLFSIVMQDRNGPKWIYLVLANGVGSESIYD